MKLPFPMIKLTGLAISASVRLWLGTLRIRYVADDEQSRPTAGGRKHVYLFWHEMMLLPAYTHSRSRIAILVSRHRDGELIAQAVRMLGGVAIRGSTNRGGLSALRCLMRQGRANHLAITPDGPHGPRRQIQIGSVYLASRTGMSLVPVGIAFSGCWRAGSWDRLALPHPWADAVAVLGKPIDVPGNLDRAGLIESRQLAQDAMDEVQARAERLAGRNHNA